MRVAAIVYIVLSTLVNFEIGNPGTFVLAALSFPLLVWLLVSKKKKPQRHQLKEKADVNAPVAS